MFGSIKRVHEKNLKSIEKNFTFFNGTILSLLFVVVVGVAAAKQNQQQSDLSDLLESQQPQNQWPSYGVYYEPNSETPFFIDEDTNSSNNNNNNDEVIPLAKIDDQALIPQEFGTYEDEGNFDEFFPHIGQCAGMAINSEDNLVLFHRSDRVWDNNTFTKENRLNKNLGAIPNATIAILDTTSGKILEEHGKNQFYMPHGLTLDSNGNYWVTDVGRHQVIKLNRKFQPILELGEKLVPGSDEKHFCKPTDVAVAKNGDFFVADGYCNSRVMKFDKNGKFLTSFGRPNSENPPKIGEFSVPHSLALIEDLNLLCVADRENQRIQCFAAGLSEGANFHPRAFVPTGTFFTKAENIGRVFAIREKHHYLVGVINHEETNKLDPQVFVMDMNTGRANTFAKGLTNAHALALSNSGDIYISQMNPNQIVRFTVPEQ